MYILMKLARDKGFAREGKDSQIRVHQQGYINKRFFYEQITNKDQTEPFDIFHFDMKAWIDSLDPVVITGILEKFAKMLYDT